jgi:phosphoribosylformylglycinamidine synthase subunit PurS
MKAHVYVLPKKTILDPQGRAIHGALTKMQFAGVADVRQGKLFVLDLDSSLTRQAAEEAVERIAAEVLSNPVIEEYSWTIE